MLLSQAVTFNGGPGVTVTLPSSMNTAGNSYFIGLFDPQSQQWKQPFLGPATVNGQTITFPLAQGGLWALKGNVSYTIAVYSLPTLTVKASYPVATGSGTMALGPDGNFWILVYNQTTTTALQKVAASGRVTSYPITGCASLAAGSDGNLWCAVNTYANGSVTSTIDKITTQGVATSYAVPNTIQGITSIAKGADGNIYFSSTHGLTTYLGKATSDGTISVLPTNNSSGYSMYNLYSAKDGNLWFQGDYGIIGYTTLQGSMTLLPYPTIPNPQSAQGYGGGGPTQMGDGSIVAGLNATPPNGGSYTGYLQVFAPGSSRPTLYQTSQTNSGQGMESVATAADGTLWFLQDPIVGHFTNNNLVEYYLPGGNAVTSNLVATPDGGMWFIQTDYNGHTMLTEFSSTSPQ